MAEKNLNQEKKLGFIAGTIQDGEKSLIIAKLERKKLFFYT